MIGAMKPFEKQLTTILQNSAGVGYAYGCCCCAPLSGIIMGDAQFFGCCSLLGAAGGLTADIQADNLLRARR